MGLITNKQNKHIPTRRNNRLAKIRNIQIRIADLGTFPVLKEDRGVIPRKQLISATGDDGKQKPIPYRKAETLSRTVTINYSQVSAKLFGRGKPVADHGGGNWILWLVRAF